MTARPHAAAVPGWRAGVEACIAWVVAMQRYPRDVWHPAYFQALDDLLVHLRALHHRGADSDDTCVVTRRSAGDPVVACGTAAPLRPDHCTSCGQRGHNGRSMRCPARP